MKKTALKDEVINNQKLNSRERDFLCEIIDNIEKEWNWPLKKIAKKYLVGMSFIYNLLLKLNIYSWKELIHNISEKIKRTGLQEVLTKNNLDFDSNLKILLAKINIEDLYLVGLGYSRISCTEIFYFLSEFTPKIYELNIKNNSYNQFLTKNMQPFSVVIYSFQGQNQIILNFLKIIRKLQRRNQIKITVFCVSTNEKNLYQNYVDYWFYVDVKKELKDPEIISPALPFILFNHELEIVFMEKRKDLLNN